MEVDHAAADPFENEPPLDTPPEVPSWAPVDLAAVLSGAIETPVPTMLARADGICLLYPGMTHSIHGESESGKSMVCQIETARLLAAGRPVTYLDFESDAASVVGRLLMFGAAADEIVAGLTYIAPDSSPNLTGDERLAFEALTASRPDLIVIDGVTEALSLFGVSSIDNDELTRWGRAFPRRLADSTGAAVVMVDHVTKSGGDRGRFAVGGQAKLSMITGAAYVAEVDDMPLGKDLRGMIRLSVVKDRPGAVRGHCGHMGASRMQEAARIIVDSTIDEDRSYVEVLEPEMDRRFEPTTVMRRVSEFVAQSTAPAGAKVIREAVGSSKPTVDAAIESLVAEGCIARTVSGTRHTYTHIRPYDPS